MSQSALVTSTATDLRALFYKAIDRRTTLATSTRSQYRREVDKAIDAGVDLRDADQLADYAATLPTSSRSFLRAATRAVTKHGRNLAKSMATPETIDQVQATIYRLDALDQAIELNPSKGKRAHIWLTAKQVRQVMSQTSDRTMRTMRDRIVLAVLMGAGLRRTELVNLRWRNVMRQGDRTVLDVIGKGSKARVIPISTNLATMLAAWRKMSAGGDDDLVARSIGKLNSLNDSLTAAQVYNIVRKFGKLIDEPKLAPHDLRRTYAQLGYLNGVPLAQLSILLGHSNEATTARYLNIKLDLDVTASDFVPL